MVDYAILCNPNLMNTLTQCKKSHPPMDSLNKYFTLKCFNLSITDVQMVPE